MAPPTAPVLLATRDRAIQNLKHRIQAVLDLPAGATSRRAQIFENRLESAWSEFSTVTAKLDGHLSSDELIPITAENLSLEDEYVEAKCMLSELIDTENSSNSSSNHNQSLNSSADIKLARIDIRPFSGKYEDWTEFKDIFDSCVASKPMPDIQKLHHLKSLLKDNAATIIKHLKLRETNFIIAWDRLKEHYDNKRRVVTSFITRFFEIPNVNSTSASRDIQKMILTTNDMRSSLPDYGIDTSSWDVILIHVLSQKLDSSTLNRWHESLHATKELPTFEMFQRFLEMRQDICESYESRRRNLPGPSGQSTPKAKAVKALATQTAASSSSSKCPFCGEKHKIHRCEKFIEASLPDKIKFVKEKQLCENCLYPHKTESCTSTYTCRECRQGHHSLLHEAQVNVVITTPESDDPASDGEASTAAVNLCQGSRLTIQSMLATALVQVDTSNGDRVTLRAMIDGGSETAIISNRAHKLIKTPTTSANCKILTLGENIQSTARHRTRLTLHSLQGDYELELSALIVPKITSVNHSISTIPFTWNHLIDLNLADPKFTELGQVDIMLGVQEVAAIMMEGIKRGPPHSPIAQETRLGWILYGGYGISPQVRCHLNTIEEENLIKFLQRFWETETLSQKVWLSPEEQLAEKLFTESVCRVPSGKLMVNLPFKIDSSDPDFLGHSYDTALKRLRQTERRLSKNDSYYAEYRKCLNEYIELGHMHEIPNTAENRASGYFMPHHAVIKESSETTKLRVVFDASCKSSNGFSLNDRLCVGPTIQKDLFELLIQWRTNRIAITGDIEKMYRMILINPSHSKFQKILWREHLNAEVRQYELQTVTFGTASAPFQAIRTLFKIADDIQATQPELSDKIRRSFYVDDFLDSCSTEEEALETLKTLSSIFQTYGLNIRKWKSNSLTVLSQIDAADRSDQLLNFEDAVHKTLGIQWNPQADTFSFKLALDIPSKANTKRTILSEIARLFDPLGWLAPAVVKAKILMQQLWLIPAGWDTILDNSIIQKWNQIRASLFQCSDIKIDRWLRISSDAGTIEIHAFADASSSAMAAAVYLKVKLMNGIHINLIAAKTKVAPIKQVSLPRLELMAAVLLTELTKKTQCALKLTNAKVIAWTDSTDVLHWLAALPHKWQTFVANRVAQIQEKIPSHAWRHVPSKLNPADCASRGLLLQDLTKHPLWWHGPKFLVEEQEKWPQNVKCNFDKFSLELKKATTILTTRVNDDLLLRYSSLDRLLTTTALCRRWLTGTSYGRPISADERDQALRRWIQTSQREAFKDDLKAIRQRRELTANSKIKNLNPYIDNDQILRIRGRLQNADLPFEQKCSIILPHDSNLTRLIVMDTHAKTLHGGIQLTLQVLRQRYWPIRGKSTVKHIIGQCVVCFRFKRRAQIQQMGNLPPERVLLSPPFYNTGVDFAGYFEIKESNRRNAPYIKAYISIFVCLSTKCVHLEVVSSLSTEAFLAAFKRFTARKLLPKRMFSDNGTNFVGASNEMPRLLQEAMSKQSTEIQRELLKDHVEWKFNPAHAPHFGGLWESTVKSVKHHLRRVLGTARLNFEEFSTVIAQIEACLNSRPLYPLSNDSDDASVISPSHLLTGHPMKLLPEPLMEYANANLLQRYKYLQVLKNQFWNQWSKEYLATLQTRAKWKSEQKNLRPDQIVLIKDDNLPPAKWLLGRIIKVYPGSDHLVRVVDVKTKDSILNRPIAKICVLPISDNE